MKPKHQHNRQFFDQLTPKSCYWAGFIAADGNIYPPNGAIRIGLAEKDKDQVKKFKAVINSTSPVRCFDTTNGYRCAQIDVYGAYECHSALDRNFNITPKKSLTLQPPNLEQKNHIRAFIRGYIDGDGSICQTKNRDKPTWSLSVLGTKNMLDWIKHQFQKHIQDLGNPQPCKQRGVFVLSFSGPQTKNILNWLYKNSSYNTRLDRKYNKYLELEKFYKQNPPRQPVSKYRGVNRNHIGKWTAEIKEPRGRRLHLGCFKTEREAALAYNEEARALGLLSRCYRVD